MYSFASSVPKYRLGKSTNCKENRLFKNSLESEPGVKQTTKIDILYLKIQSNGIIKLLVATAGQAV